jgi:hypothetical protein
MGDFFIYFEPLDIHALNVYVSSKISSIWTEW